MHATYRIKGFQKTKKVTCRLKLFLVIYYSILVKFYRLHNFNAKIPSETSNSFPKSLQMVNYEQSLMRDQIEITLRHSQYIFSPRSCLF